METGIIIRLNLEKGYGFVKRDGGKGDAFFHCSQIGDGLVFDETLQERRVKFDVTHSERGWQAVNVCAAD